VFDNQAPTEWRADLFRLIRETPALDWQLLTKRPQNIARMLPSDWSDGYANVWLGTTTEDAERYRMRWPILSRVPADRRFISYEPAIALLGRLDVATARCLPDWVICGGESGGHARVINPAWARHVRDQCRALGVPFLHKQWGTYRSNPLVQERGLSSAEAQRRDPPSNGKGARCSTADCIGSFPANTSSRFDRESVPQLCRVVFVKHGRARAVGARRLIAERRVIGLNRAPITRSPCARVRDLDVRHFHRRPRDPLEHATIGDRSDASGIRAHGR